jgi:hypothetical protein
VLTPASSDRIDVEKFTDSGNVFKMLLGRFIEEMDHVNDETEDDSTPDNDTQSIKTSGHMPTVSLPLRSIHGMSEEISQFRTFPSPSEDAVGGPGRGATEQKSRKRGMLSSMFARL